MTNIGERESLHAFVFIEVENGPWIKMGASLITLKSNDLINRTLHMAIVGRQL